MCFHNIESWLLAVCNLMEIGSKLGISSGLEQRPVRLWACAAVKSQQCGWCEYRWSLLWPCWLRVSLVPSRSSSSSHFSNFSSPGTTPMAKMCPCTLTVLSPRPSSLLSLSLPRSDEPPCLPPHFRALTFE
jgi:hypothetical protein